MAHDHHHHTGHRKRSTRRLTITLALTASYMVAEVVGGLITGSLALLADAGHMLSDVAAIALALFAMWIAQRPSTPQSTYGYQRTEILAALLNGAALVAVAGGILFEAFERLSDPPAVQGGLMLLIAGGGLAVNLAALLVLHGSRKDSLNMRGAFLHVVSDALGSVGAMIAGTLILLYGWRWADPIASAVIALLVINSAWGLLKETVSVLMETAPDDVDVDAIRTAMAEVAEVKAVHDLHVWTITSDMVCMSVHIVTVAEADHHATLKTLTELVRTRFKIQHVTIQLEDERFACLQDDCADATSTAA